MGRGTALNIAERAKIDILKDLGLSGRAIAKKNMKSVNVVCFYLRNKILMEKI